MKRRDLLRGFGALLGGAAVASVPLPVAAPAPVELVRQEIPIEDASEIADIAYWQKMGQMGLVSRGTVLEKMGLSISDEVRDFYNRQMLANAEARIVHQQFTLGHDAFGVNTRTMEWRRYGES